MKNCVLSEILLVSFLEKRAKRIVFNPTVTTIVGANDTGKSTLLKSIYWTFGAEPAETHPKWEAANVATLVRFAIDGRRFSVLRQGESTALFDDANNVMGSFTSVTSGLGPVLADLLDFEMIQTDRGGNKIVPPPAYFLLPFYVDQDRSWNDNWASFARLQQLANYRQFMAEYHSGIRPNEYYRVSADLESEKQQLQQVKAELEAVQAARRTFDHRLPFDGFNIDVAAFSQDVDRLLRAVQTLAADENRYKSQIQDLRGQAGAILMQMKLVEREASELGADYKFAASPAQGARLECPVCGTLHENSFAERFAIARDEDRCRDLFHQLREDLQKVHHEIERATKAFQSISAEKSETEEVLATRRGAITLRDVINAQGRAEVQKVFAESVNTQVSAARALEVSVATRSRKLRQLDDRKRKTEILTFYRARMRDYLDRLDVQNLDAKSYSTIAARIREIGSDKPRALLAYYYSFLETMRKFGSSVFCPIIIDEPNQQGLDPERLPAVIRFIYERQPQGTQLILGVENLHGVEPPGVVIELTEKWSLLSSDQYSEIAAEVRPRLQDTFRLESED